MPLKDTTPATSRPTSSPLSMRTVIGTTPGAAEAGPAKGTSTTTASKERRTDPLESDMQHAPEAQLQDRRGYANYNTHSVLYAMRIISWHGGPARCRSGGGPPHRAGGAAAWAEIARAAAYRQRQPIETRHPRHAAPRRPHGRGASRGPRAAEASVADTAGRTNGSRRADRPPYRSGR